MLDVEGEDFYDPAADGALFDALRDNLDDHVELIERETDVNDDAFAETIVDKLDEFKREAGNGPDA
ncbi:MAG: Tm-1-like ATP-binding domain-containing protein [Halapricum sp.]